MPIRIEGDGRVERVIVERTRLEDQRAIGTGEHYAIECGLVVSAIGYKTPRIEGVPFDDKLGRFVNEEGVIEAGEGGLYCVGWARRGPSGTIGTNRPDGYEVAAKIATTLGPGSSGKAGRAGLDELLESRGVDIVTFRDWQKIEQAEATRARSGSPREKFTTIEEMLAVLEGLKLSFGSLATIPRTGVASLFATMARSLRCRLPLPIAAPCLPVGPWPDAPVGE